MFVSFSTQSQKMRSRLFQSILYVDLELFCSERNSFVTAELKFGCRGRGGVAGNQEKQVRYTPNIICHHTPRTCI